MGGAVGLAGTCKVGGQVLRSSVSFKTILKPLRVRCREGVSLFRLGNGLERGLCTCPENLTSEWKMARFGAFCVLFLQTAVI